ncbi:MAG: DUF1329 domain-containing protein [Pseudomonadales bacterium]|nr:DUF1329 domain-containing protein [Pseudomonadales bacterium]
MYTENKTNVDGVSLGNNGNSLNGWSNGVPFPIPQSALEIVWNHTVRYRGESVSRAIGQATPQPNGRYNMVVFDDNFTFRSALQGDNIDPNVMFYYKQKIVAPARLAGNVILVHETIDQVKEPRKAWIYNAGQRRVRRAPQVAYDGPGSASDGLRTSDNFDMFNGAPDRYDWKLIGKKEMYIPYNSYKLQSPKLKYDDIVKAGHINQDHTRYELHRVWEIEATLKDGARHIYAKRHFYIDEDSYQIAEADHYDGRGNLWRVGEGHGLQIYAIPTYWLTLETLYDLVAKRYMALGFVNEIDSPYTYNAKATVNDYKPASLRRSGVR